MAGTNGNASKANEEMYPSEVLSVLKEISEFTHMEIVHANSYKPPVPPVLEGFRYIGKASDDISPIGTCYRLPSRGSAQKTDPSAPVEYVKLGPSGVEPVDVQKISATPDFTETSLAQHNMQDEYVMSVNFVFVATKQKSPIVYEPWNVDKLNGFLGQTLDRKLGVTKYFELDTERKRLYLGYVTKNRTLAPTERSVRLYPKWSSVRKTDVRGVEIPDLELDFYRESWIKKHGAKEESKDNVISKDLKSKTKTVVIALPREDMWAQLLKGEIKYGSGSDKTYPLWISLENFQPRDVALESSKAYNQGRAAVSASSEQGIFSRIFSIFSRDASVNTSRLEKGADGTTDQLTGTASRTGQGLSARNRANFGRSSSDDQG